MIVKQLIAHLLIYIYRTFLMLFEFNFETETIFLQRRKLFCRTHNNFIISL